MVFLMSYPMSLPLLTSRRAALKNISVTAASLVLPWVPAVASTMATSWDIVQIVDTSTLQQDIAKDFLTGARAAWQSINGQGGLHGQKIRHVVIEVDGTEASVRKAYATAQSSSTCLALAGTVGERTSQLIAQWLQEAPTNLAHVAPWLQTSERARSPQTFVICADRQMQIAHAAAYWAGFGVKEFGIIYASAQEQAAHRPEIERIGQALKIKMAHMPVQANLENIGSALPTNAPGVQLFIGGTPEMMALVQGLEAHNRSSFIMGLSDINLQTIQQLGAAKKTAIIVAQSVPLVTSGLPIVRAYRAAMAQFFDEPPTPLGLSGFISARYTHEVLSRTNRPLSRQAALNAFAQREPIDLGGFKINYRGTERGSQFVTLSMLGQEGKSIG
jgi:ABC-type branched-subunit amino acid transport system substrate-binding protein